MQMDFLVHYYISINTSLYFLHFKTRPKMTIAYSKGPERNISITQKELVQYHRVN